MRSSTSRALAALASSAALAAAGTLVAGPAAAASGPDTTVTVFFKAPHPVALAKLAYAHGLTHAQRVAAVDRLVPSQSAQSNVAALLGADGFSTTSRTAWSLTARGPASTAAALFGTRPALGAHPSAARYRAATGALPAVPSAIAGAVSAVYPTTGGPQVFHGSATSSLAGPDFRNADTPATVVPSTGLQDAGTTVATLQLSDFYGGDDDTASDLVSYAAEHSLPNPVSDKQFLPVKVDGGPSTEDDATGGDLEVNLDQESILSTAPSADQHAYFAPNTQAGFNDVFSHVFDDVVGNKDATAKDPNITALSSSWGECESDTGATNIDTLEPIIESLVAAGVTVFASAGDDGIYDCGSTTMTGTDDDQADVDYPASSPYVVSVGGTNLSAQTSAANTGSNWTESTWTCTDTTSCESSVPGTLPGLPDGTGGGGGGESGSAYDASTSGSFKGFPKPAYQAETITSAPFATARHRLVPDIAADGDPETGFVEYTSDPPYVLAYGGGSNDVQVGGTSLSSPISAAQLDNTLANAGRTTGVGDIHGALYSAYAKTASLAATDPAKAFRDVTVGQNGAEADKGIDPSVTARAGFDTTSGLGGVLWSALTPYLLDKHTPSVTSSLKLTSPYGPTKSPKVAAKWTASQGADSSLLGPSTVTITAVGSKTPVYTTTTAPASGAHDFTATPGTTYHLTVTAADISGRTSPKATHTLVVPVDDKSFTFSHGWTRAGRRGDIAASHENARTKGATATVTATGKSFALVFDSGPARGKLSVYVGKTLVKTINEYTATHEHLTKTIYTASASKTVTFRFVVQHAKTKASAGRSVDVDGLLARR